MVRKAGLDAMQDVWGTSPTCDTSSKQDQSAKQSLAWDVERSESPWHDLNVVSFQISNHFLYLYSNLLTQEGQNIYLYFLICIRGPIQPQSAISPFWLNYWFRLPWFENELAIIVAVHAEVEEDLAGARDQDGGADDAPVHAGQEEQEHGKGWEGEPWVKVERCQERHRGSRRVLEVKKFYGILKTVMTTCNQ